MNNIQRLDHYIRQAIAGIPHSAGERRQALADFQAVAADLSLATAAAKDLQQQLDALRKERQQ